MEREGKRMPLVLGMVKQKEKEAAIQEICRKQKLQYRALERSDTEKELGVLCGIYDVPIGKHGQVPILYQLPELLLFSGMPGDSLDLFLAAYRKEGLEPIALKAVVTPHNVMWNLHELAAELAAEDAKMRKK